MLKQQMLKGFTLLEVMLAMTLLSIMVALLFASLKTAAESWEKGESKISQVNEKAVTYQFFKRHIPAIKPLWDYFSDQRDRTFSFNGTRDRFQFVSVFPESAERKGMQLFKIVFDPSGTGKVNVVLSPFYPIEVDLKPEDEEVVLLENVERFEVNYFDNHDSDGDWVENWQAKEYLPALIKITITLADQSYWPSMIFDLKLAKLASYGAMTTDEHGNLGIEP